jgi:hypothetical protein
MQHEQAGSPFTGKGESSMGDLADGDDLPERLQWAKNMLSLFTTLSQDEAGHTDSTRQVHITGGAQAIRECAQQASKTQKRLADLLRGAKNKQVSAACKHFKGTSTAVPPDASWDELLERVAQGDKILPPFIHVTSHMAKLKANMEEVAKTHFEANSFAARLMLWLHLPIHTSVLSSEEVNAELAILSSKDGCSPLFQVQEAS